MMQGRTVADHIQIHLTAALSIVRLVSPAAEAFEDSDWLRLSSKMLARFLCSP